jgi:hypothetical protein
MDMEKREWIPAFTLLVCMLGLCSCGKKTVWQPDEKDPLKYYAFLSSPPPTLPRTTIMSVSDINGGFGARGEEPNIKVIDSRYYRTIVLDVSERADPALNMRTRPNMVADEYAHYIRERAREYGFPCGSSHATAHGKMAHSSDCLAIVVTGCWMKPDNPTIIQLQELHLAWGFAYLPKLGFEKELANKPDLLDG